MKLIQLCGTNGVGKTTSVLQFCEHRGMTAQVLEIDKRQYDYHTDGKAVVLGRYGLTKCGGIDGKITDKRVLKYVIIQFLRRLKPEVLVFEALVYGNTFTFRWEMAQLAKTLGYEYTAVCIVPPLDVAIDRTYERNGNDVNVEQIAQKYFQALKSSAKLKQAGVNVRVIDTSKVQKEEMYRNVEDAIC